MIKNAKSFIERVKSNNSIYTANVIGVLVADELNYCVAASGRYQPSVACRLVATTVGVRASMNI